jgi:DNA-binding response OmpR family regulator
MSNFPVMVLVVDDEEPLRHLVRQYLEREGFAVVTAGDGIMALEVARRDAPAVVVLDWMLPGWTGWRSAAACAPSPTPT